MKPETRHQVAETLRAAADTLSAKRVTPADELAAQLESAIKAVFPNSAVKAVFTDNISPTITIWFALQGDKSKHENGIVHNDPMYSLYFIHGLGADGSVPEKITIDSSDGGSVAVKPDPGSMMAYGRLKLGWRKKTGSPADIVRHVAKYFTNAKRLIKDNLARLPDSFDPAGLL